MSANPAEKKPVRYRAPSPSDKVNGRDNDSDNDSATGEYIEVKFNLIPYTVYIFLFHLTLVTICKAANNSLSFSLLHSCF